QCTCVKQAVRVSDLPPQRNQHSITEPRSCLPLNAVKSALANLSGAWLSRHRNSHASPHPLSSACRYPVLGAELVSAGSTPDYFFRSLVHAWLDVLSVRTDRHLRTDVPCPLVVAGPPEPLVAPRRAIHSADPDDNVGTAVGLYRWPAMDPVRLPSKRLRLEHHYQARWYRRAGLFGVQLFRLRHD